MKYTPLVVVVTVTEGLAKNKTLMLIYMLLFSSITTKTIDMTLQVTINGEKRPL